MAEGRKLPAVFDHYIVPDATESQFMAFVSKDLKVLKYSIEVLVLILITVTETYTHTRTVLLKFVKYSECT